MPILNCGNLPIARGNPCAIYILVLSSRWFYIVKEERGMVKRVIVFDNSEAPSVVVRKARKKEAQPVKADSGKPAGIENPSRKTSDSKPVAAAKLGKSAGQPKKQPKAQPEKKPEFIDNKKKAIETYQSELRAAAERSRARENSDNPKDAEYYAMKTRFLDTLMNALETGKEAEQTNFEPLAEPLFWNEFKRLAELRKRGPQIETPKGPQVVSTWKKAINAQANKLALYLNELRKKRDNFVLRTYPKSVFEIAMHLNGALMHLERQIAADPENASLRKLLEVYFLVYNKSGISQMAKKIASNIQKKEESHGIHWKNQETLTYLLAHTN